MTISVASETRAPLLVTAAAAGFVLVICGSNAITPLLPYYQDRHGFGAFASAAVFSMYFLALMTVLLVAARSSLVRYARRTLPAALLVGVVADLMLIGGDTLSGLLFPARFLTGSSVALATGAAAAVMVAVRGEQGRAFIGTGSLLGAGGGLASAIVIVVFIPAPSITVYALHAVLLMCCLALLLIGLRKAPWVLAVAPGPPPVPPTPGPRLPLRVSIGAHLLGSLSWAVGALAVGVLPAALLDHSVTDSLFVSLILCGTCLFASSAGGLAGLGSGRIGSAGVPAAALAVGWGITTGGLVADWPIAIVAGGVISGLAQAMGYRTGLARLSQGLDPVRQGKMASGYSAASYAGAGVFVLGAGLCIAGWGVVGGMVAIGVVFVLCCGASAVTLRTAQHLPIPADIIAPEDELADQTVHPSLRNPLN